MAAKNRFNHIDCLGSALEDEEYFVLLARDPAFAYLIAIWASLRVGNVTAAAENFTLLMSPELVQHYQLHPDIAKSEEAIATAQRGAAWRDDNLTAGPNGTPTWKQSLVRPQMIDLVAQETCPRCHEFTCECESVLMADPGRDAAYLREKGRQLGYDQGGDKLIEIADRLCPEETHGDMS